MTSTALPATSLSLPFIGRERELALMDSARDEVTHGRGQLVLLSGDGGVGKTRLVQESAQHVRDAGWQVAIGQAYPLETAIPYAAFADALAPVLAALDPGTLTRLTRGDRAVLAALAPALLERSGGSSNLFADGVTHAEQRVRLHAAILQLIAKLAERKPLLLGLENMQWADSSSIELVHFLGRQLGAHRVLLVASWNETDRTIPEEWRLAVRSLRSLGAATDVRLTPLGESDVRALLARQFSLDELAVSTFATRLHHVTQGNPFFLDQMLRELVARGDLRQQGGVWVGWHHEPLALPPSVRDVLDARLSRLSPEARHAANVLAVAGSTATHDVLRRVAGQDDPTLTSALRELRDVGLLAERTAGDTVLYTFVHPMLQQALLADVGLARERALHAEIALAIEAMAGAQADAQAESIAAHWLRADPRVQSAVAVRWLVAAGGQALLRLARREAADMLRAALDRCDAHPDLVPADMVPRLVDELSRLYRRLGEYQQAIAMCRRARERAAAHDDDIGIAVAERRLGLSLQGLGRREEAIAHFDDGIAHAIAAGDDTLVVRTQLAKGDCLQALGLIDNAKQVVAEALATAERLDQLPLLARAHRLLLILHLWTGPAHRAWAHARSAVALAERCGERNLAWSAHWAAAVLGGLTSHTSALATHLAEATRLAAELNSPLLELRTMEIALEYRAGTGEWDRVLADGERALEMARALDQTTLLARLLHWVSGVYLQRGDMVTAQRMVQEAWTVSGAATLDLSRPFEVHGVLPAFVARTRYLDAVGERAQAIALGRQALAIADRTGYIAWAVYRLLPTVADAALAVHDVDAITLVRERLAHDAARLAHPIGTAWVGVIDGELALEAGRADDAVPHLQAAIATLESVPYPFDAARTRLRLARALVATGAREEAVREAREALGMLEKLGARPSCDDARALLRELGARLPTSRHQQLVSGLTARELEIVQLVAQRLSNKEIGARLGITSRTAGTHLANIYDKLGVRDRTALGDLAREQGLHR
jgi:DNA-binding CsgD family transcriptional regulator